MCCHDASQKRCLTKLVANYWYYCWSAWWRYHHPHILHKLLKIGSNLSRDSTKKQICAPHKNHSPYRPFGGKGSGSVVTLRRADISHQHTQKKVNIFLGEWDEGQHLTHTNKHTWFIIYLVYVLVKLWPYISLCACVKNILSWPTM